MSNEPTEAQKKAGNYKKDHVFAHGMRFSVENKAGTTRKGTGKDGKPWEFTMAHDYGYVRGSKGKDKDHVDVFFGPDRDNAEGKVFVIDQDDDEGNFDEHKAMVGFPDASAAYAAYHENYPEGHGGFRALTEMSLPEFRKWAYIGRDGGKRKRVSELAAYKRGGSVEEFPDGAEVDPAELQEHFEAGAKGKPDDHCACGNGTVMMAEGGSVDEAVADLPAFVGYRGRRKERNNDRKGAKEVPVQALRGLLAGTLGFGGDVEGLGRTLARAAGANVDEDSALPTSEFYSDILPLKPGSAAGRAAGSAGAMFGVPASAAALGGLRAAGKAAPAVKGALTRIAENAARSEPLIPGRVGAAARQSGAVKLPGGNWYDPVVEKATKNARGWEPEREFDRDMLAGISSDPSVADWMERRLNKYIRNQMGTASDPLLKLEQEGALHLTPEQLQDLYPGSLDFLSNTPDNALLHKKLTGRTGRTPWEALSDSMIVRENAGAMRGLKGAPDWLKKLPDDTPVYDLDTHGIEDLGFGHVRDYLDLATSEHGTNSRLAARGLTIDPAKLNTVSLPDAVRKTSDWNKMMSEMRRIEDRNKGIKQVLKQYEAGHPNEGFQWAELGPEGLADEGNAMGHCVGGYCRDVEGGDVRIVSLRDKEGQPHVTVELAKKQKRPELWYADQPKEIVEKYWPEYRPRDGGLSSFTLKQESEWKEMLKSAPEYQKHLAESPWDIRQIKGKQNAAPVKAYLPAVQDFVRSMGPWGDVSDLQNTGLRDAANVFSPTESKFLELRGRKPSGYLSQSEIDDLQKLFGSSSSDPAQGYAQGGTVIGEETVGQARFNPSPQGRTVNLGGSYGGPISAPSASSGLNLPAPLTTGGADYRPNRENAPIFSASGLSHDVSQPYSQMGGVVNPALRSRNFGAVNPGAMDPALRETLTAGHAGWIDRGANAFLGGAFNPWTKETGPAEGEKRDSPDAAGQLDALFELGGALGIDTGRYSRDPGSVDIRGNRSGSFDAMGLYDAINDATKDYVSVGGLASGWAGGGPGNASHTVYKEVDGRLLPVTRPQFHQNNPDTSFIGRDVMEMIGFIGPALLGGFGGWAGLTGTTGTAMAPVANAAGNMAVGYARGGEQGALSSLLGSAGGMAGGYAGGALGNAVGSQYGNIGSQIGSQIGSRIPGMIRNRR